MKLYIVLCNMSSCIKKKTNDKYKLIFEKQSLAFPLYIHRGKNSSHRHGAKQSKRQHLLHFLIPFSPHIFILISNLVHNDGLRALSSAALSGSRSCQREGLWRGGMREAEKPAAGLHMQLFLQNSSPTIVAFQG